MLYVFSISTAWAGNCTIADGMQLLHIIRIILTRTFVEL
jgi:hypothetical protein